MSVLAVAQYLSAGLGFAESIILARLLGPDFFGQLALAASFPTLVGAFVGLKTVAVTTRYLSGYHASGERQPFLAVLRAGYVIDVTLSFVAFALVVVAGQLATGFVRQNDGFYLYMVLFAAAFPIYSLTGSSYATFSVLGQFRWVSIFSLMEQLLSLTLSVTFVAAGGGVAGGILGGVLAKTIVGTGAAVQAARLLRLSGYSRWWGARSEHIRDVRRELLGLFKWNYVAVTLNGLVQQAPALLLGRFAGATDVGYFRVASNLLNAASYVEASLNRVTYPKLSARWMKGDRSGTQGQLKEWSIRLGAAASLVPAGGIIIMPIAVPILFGSDYRPAVPWIQLMLGSAVVSAIFFWLNSFFHSTGRLDKLVKINATWGAVLILVIWWAAGRWAFPGVAAASTVMRIILSLALVRVAWSISGRERQTLSTAEERL